MVSLEILVEVEIGEVEMAGVEIGAAEVVSDQ